MRICTLIALMSTLLLGGCAQTPSEVRDQVLIDFGIKAPPEGYTSQADLVRERLNEVGATELRRLNLESRFGEVKFQEEGGLSGRYYKERKVYEDFFPLDARPSGRGDRSDVTFVGYIRYNYRLYQSPRVSTRTEAAAATADIPTTEFGREVYRYNFRSGGLWDGNKGERARRSE